MWKSAGRAPSLRDLSWHLPYNVGKSMEKPVRVNKNLSQNTLYVLPKQTLITKPTHTHTRTQTRTQTQNPPPTHTHTHTHTHEHSHLLTYLLHGAESFLRS
jgi:hypothetical protein